MTLTKAKPRKPSADMRKRSGHHHRHNPNYLKTYWPYLPIVTILGVSLLLNSSLARVNRDVLGYATDISTQSLLVDTNQQRTSSGESGLQLNSKLTHAAQSKADDMAKRDYWSHTTPDGQAPWVFIRSAGYDYQVAGENLAYGFATASDTINGWMHSPEHRANILNATYRDVGFGIANIADYQSNGPETLVVAMYGTLSGVSIGSAQTDHNPLATSNTQPALKGDATEPATQARVTQFQLVASNIPMNIFVLSAISVAACLFLILRHSLAWRRALVRGEAFALHHPYLDIAAVTVVSASILLSHTVGLIR